MAERSPHHSKTEGSSPAAAADTARDRIVNKIDQLGAGSQRKNALVNNCGEVGFHRSGFSPKRVFTECP